MPQARNSRIPPSGSDISAISEPRIHTAKAKPQAFEKPSEARGSPKRRGIVFLICIPALLFGGLLIWAGLNSINARPVAVASFSVIPGSQHLYATFQLVNSEGKPVSAAGSGTIEFYDGLGNFVARQQISFTKKDFGRDSRAYFVAIPKTKLDLSSSVNRSNAFAAVMGASASLSKGSAILTVTLNNNKKTFTAVCSEIQFYSVEEAALIVRRIYFQEEIQAFEEEINKQWPFKVKINDYVSIEDRGWVVVSRSGSEIIFYPYGKIYNWYLLESQDGGRSWDIAWRGDTAPLFRVDIVDESVLKVTTPSGVFHINFKGEEAVSFVDPTPKGAIVETLGIAKGLIYPSHLDGLTSLSAGGRHITNLTGLEHCANLAELYLQENQISDISSLVNNSGLGDGDTVGLTNNPLSEMSLNILT